MRKYFSFFFLLVFLCNAPVPVFGQSSSTPVLSALSPNSAVAGGPGLSVTVTGSNFCRKCVALWNGAQRRTQIVSSTQAIVTLYSTDIQLAGTDSIQMLNPRNGSQSNALSFTVTASSAVTVTVSPSSTSLQCGSSQQFTASVSGSTNASVTWAASGGSISSNGMYSAPTATGSYVVTATSVADTGKSASAKVTVSAPVSVTISPISASMLTGGTQQFTASVSGSSNTSVTWTATGGTVSSSGVYTAPATAGTYTVTATSVADPTKSAAATVTVTAPVVAVSVSPSLASLSSGATQQFTATVTGSSNTAVTWSATGGSISSGGLYTAPTSAGTYSVRATSAADSTKSASASVTVTTTAATVLLGDQNVESSLDSNSQGQAEAFPSTASASGTVGYLSVYLDSSSTTAQLILGLYTDASGHPGTLLSQGKMSSPRAGAWNTIAVSAANVVAGARYWIAVLGTGSGSIAYRDTTAGSCSSETSAQTTLTSLPTTWSTGAIWSTCTASAYASGTAASVAVAIAISPTSASLLTGGTQSFSATVTGTTNTAVTWSATGGTISSAGFYTAPTTAGTYTVKATSAADSTKSASATVTVSAPVVAVTVSPASVSLATGATQQFTASVTGSSNTAVAWSTTGGSISNSGLYTAPASAGTYLVMATSAADSTKSASATVTVGASVQHSVTLTWSAESAVAGYNVYRGSVSGGPYSMINGALDASANYADLSVQSGQTYFYVVTAVDSSGVESAYSSEVKAVIPTP